MEIWSHLVHICKIFLGCWTELNGTSLLFLTHKCTSGCEQVRPLWRMCGCPAVRPYRTHTPSHRTIQLFAFICKMFQTNYFYLFWCFLLFSLVNFFLWGVFLNPVWIYNPLFPFPQFMLLGTVLWINSKTEFKLIKFSKSIISNSSKEITILLARPFYFKLWLHFQLYITNVFTVMQRGKIYLLPQCTC